MSKFNIVKFAAKPFFIRSGLLLSMVTVMLSFSLIKAYSQNFETVFSNGYDTQVEDLDRLSDGRWLITYVASPTPGSLYQDTIYARIVDSTAALIRYISITPLMNFENLTLESTIVLPGDEFLIMYSGGDCDAGGYGYYLYKFDSLMQPAWHIHFPHHGGELTFAISPDGNILFLSGREIGKMSPADGSVLWEANYTTEYINEAIVIPGTENIIMANGDGLFYFEQEIIQGEISYSLKASAEVEVMFGSFRGLIAGPAGTFYALKYHEREVLKFRKDLQYEVVFDVTFDLINMAATPDGITVMNRIGFNEFEILFYDTSGTLLETYNSPVTGLRPSMIISSPEGFGIGGWYSSGPPWSYDTTYLYSGRGQGWFRHFPNYSLVDSAAEVSIAITDIIQQDSILHSTYWISDGFYQGYVHDYEGGNFKLELTNTGNEPVHSFWINIYFGEVLNIFWCNPYLATEILIENVTILPGESIWHEFGDISAYRQQEYPEAFCFWTSGPNYNPDFIPDDDVYCHQRIVSTQTVQDEYSFSIYPNPADEEINVTLAENYLNDTEWVLVDILGRKIKSGSFESNLGTHRIDLADVRQGIYYLSAGLFSENIIIQHP